MHRALLPLILLGAALSGCVTAPTLDVAGAPALPAAYVYRCAGEASAEACAAELVDLRTAYQEPYAAADRSRPGVFAVGVNAGPSEVDRAMGAPDGSTARCQNDILLTEDGGATWRYVETPRPAAAYESHSVRDYCGGDPALLFDADGVLHHSGIARGGPLGNGYVVYYTKSPDLGASWSEPVVLSGGTEEDRNWIGLAPDGTLYVVWQHFNGDGGTAVALSTDGGDSWNTELPELGEACFTTSPPVFDGATLLLGCSMYGEEQPLVRLLERDAATGAYAVRADLPSAAYWPKLAWAGRALYLFVDEFGSATTTAFAASADAGRTWTAFEAASKFLPEDFPRANHEVQWLATDPWGRVHIVWQGHERVSLTVTARTVESAFGHAVVDESGALLQASRLGPGNRITEPEAPKTMGGSLGNHYMGLAFNATSGLLVWSEDATLEYAMVEAAPSA